MRHLYRVASRHTENYYCKAPRGVVPPVEKADICYAFRSDTSSKTPRLMCSDESFCGRGAPCCFYEGLHLRASKPHLKTEFGGVWKIVPAEQSHDLVVQ